ncbi:hypothetical protein [Moraxella lacunata]
MKRVKRNAKMIIKIFLIIEIMPYMAIWHGIWVAPKFSALYR